VLQGAHFLPLFMSRHEPMVCPEMEHPVILLEIFNMPLSARRMVMHCKLRPGDMSQFQRRLSKTFAAIVWNIAHP
jgi:hypothetical protein